MKTVSNAGLLIKEVNDAPVNLAEVFNKISKTSNKKEERIKSDNQVKLELYHMTRYHYISSM